jgi:hypothetical protein
MRLILFLLAFNLHAQVFHDDVVIGDRENIDPVNVLFVNSVTKGSIPFPRMTVVQRDAIPAPIPDGTIVYVTDHNLKSVYDGAKSAWLLENPLYEFVVANMGVAPDPSLADNQGTNLFNEETLMTYKSIEVSPGDWRWVNQAEDWDSDLAYRVSGIISQAGDNAPTEDIANNQLDAMDAITYRYQADGIIRSFPGGDDYEFPTATGTAGENRVVYYGLSQAGGNILQGRLSLVDEDSFYILGSCLIDTTDNMVAGSCDYFPQLSVSSQAYRQNAVVVGFSTSGLSIQGIVGQPQFETSPYASLQEGVGYLVDKQRPYSRTIGQQDPVQFTMMNEDSHLSPLPIQTPVIDTSNYYDTTTDAITAIPVTHNAACGTIAANVSGDFIYLVPNEDTIFTDFADSLQKIDDIDAILVTPFKISGYQTIANICYEKALADFSDKDKLAIRLKEGGGGTLASAAIPADRSVTKIKLVVDLENEINLSTTRADKSVYHVDALVSADPAADGVYIIDTVVPAIGNNANEIWERGAGIWTLFKPTVTGTQVIIKDDSEPLRYIYTGTAWVKMPIYEDMDENKIAIGAAPTEDTALLELNSTTHGFLPPRMTTVERDAIVTPPNGLYIYNTDDDENQHWDGIEWVNSAGIGGVHPITSTDNAIARYDLLVGALQNSGIIIDDNDKMDFKIIATVPSFTIEPDGTDTNLSSSGFMDFTVDGATNPLLLLDDKLIEIDESSTLRFEGDNGFDINFNHPNGIIADINYTLPTTAGVTGQFLTTDGAGVLSWSGVTIPEVYVCGSSNTNATDSTGANLVDVFGGEFYFLHNRPRWEGHANAHRYSITKDGNVYENNRGVIDSAAWQYMGVSSLDADGDVMNIHLVRENTRQAETAHIYAVRAGTAINFCVLINTP